MQFSTWSDRAKIALYDTEADMERMALVLGATGGIGGAVARRLIAGGWQVRGLVREGRADRLPAGVTAMIGDARDTERVAQAAEGASLIVHAVNPPGYRDWDRLVLPMLDATIAAARPGRARVLLPGTVYNYAPDARRRSTKWRHRNRARARARCAWQWSGGYRRRPRPATSPR
jgi:nucleoside-diphosphate-sugar epimerase